MTYPDKTESNIQNRETGGSDHAPSDQTASTARDAVSEVAGKARSAAEEVSRTVASEASGYARDAKNRAADEVRGVSSALRTAADDLRSGSPAERAFSQIADGLADASETIRGKDLGEVIRDVNAFARSNPLTFLGGAALIGFAATRFARASTDRELKSESDAYAGGSAASMRTPASAGSTYATGGTYAGDRS